LPVSDHRLTAIAVAAVAGSSFASERVIHLGIQGSFRERLLQVIKKAVRIEGRLRIRPSQKLVQDRIRSTRLSASWHAGLLSTHHARPHTNSG
jgi:hypothetical protein